MMISNDIAKLVRYFRKQGGLSQQQLAQLAGVGKTAVFDIEQGKSTLRLNTLLKVLDALNIKLEIKTPFTPDISYPIVAKARETSWIRGR